MSRKGELVGMARDLIHKSATGVLIAQFLLEGRHKEEAETATKLHEKLDELDDRLNSIFLEENK